MSGGGLFEDASGKTIKIEDKVFNPNPSPIALSPNPNPNP